jgi:23S rRNA pseudouridine2605 synthase
MAVHGAPADAVRRAIAARPVVDGRPVAVVAVSARPKGRSVEVELTLAEGRHRIVRRLAEALDLKVEWLHRVTYGPVRLGDLPEGRSRPLTRREIDAIERLRGAT